MHPKMRAVLNRLYEIHEQNPSPPGPHNWRPNGVLETTVPYNCWRMPAKIPLGFMLNMYSGNGTQYWTSYMKGEEPEMGSTVHRKVSGSFYHSHDYFEFTYVIDGVYSELVINENIELHSGELTLLDMNSIHRVQANPVKSDILYLSFNKEYLTQELLDACSPDMRTFIEDARMNRGRGRQVVVFRPHSPADKFSTEETLADILTELMERRPGYETVVKGYMVRFFAALAGQYGKKVHSVVGSERRLIMFHEISAFIRENLDTVTIDILEQKYHYGRNYFSRLFREMAGLTYSEYLRSARLDRAEELLRTTDLSVRTITQLLGYENRKYLYDVFREKYGVTPAEYRRRYGARTG